MRILAIDPGYDRMGIAVLEGDPSTPMLVWSNCITPAKGAPAARLSEASQAVEMAIRTYKPDAGALEGLFFSKNVKTALGVAEARGAILAVFGRAGLSVIECSPQEVKIAVTGYGAADKKAVLAMVPKLLILEPRKRLDDELDAIAVGICALAKNSVFS
jgi:crossover junction endodeoxyribonuclease RuvC